MNISKSTAQQSPKAGQHLAQKSEGQSPKDTQESKDQPPAKFFKALKPNLDDKIKSKDLVFYYSSLATKIAQYLSVKDALTFFSTAHINRQKREAYFIHKLVSDFKLSVPEIQAQEQPPLIDIAGQARVERPVEELYKSYSTSLTKLQKLALNKLNGLLRPAHFWHILPFDRVFSSENKVDDFCYLLKSRFNSRNEDLKLLVVQVAKLVQQIPDCLDGLIAHGYSPEVVFTARNLSFTQRESLTYLLLNSPRPSPDNEIAAERTFNLGVNFIMAISQRDTLILRLISTLKLSITDEAALVAMRDLSLAFNDGVVIKHLFAIEYMVKRLMLTLPVAINNVMELNSQQAEAVYTLELSFADIQLLQQFRVANNNWYNNSHTEIFEYLMLKDNLSFSQAYSVLAPLTEEQRVAIKNFGLRHTQVPQLIKIGGNNLSYADIRNAKFLALKKKIDPLQALASEKLAPDKLN